MITTTNENGEFLVFGSEGNGTLLRLFQDGMYFCAREVDGVDPEWNYIGDIYAATDREVLIQTMIELFD